MSVSIKSDIIGKQEQLGYRGISANSKKGSQRAMVGIQQHRNRIVTINGANKSSMIHDLLRRYGTTLIRVMKLVKKTCFQWRA